MNFFVQLDLSTLPEQSKVPARQGLLQLYYCSTDDGSCETWEPFSGTHYIRVTSSGPSLLNPPHGIDPLAKVSVGDWQQFQDAPHPEDHASLGLSINYDFKNNVADVVSTEPRVEATRVSLELNPAETISNSEPGDKLGGWPYWVQGSEYPRCPDCGQQMDLLLQIDSNDNLDYMFGDVGCAHLTYCPRHPSVFAFGWACS